MKKLNRYFQGHLDQTIESRNEIILSSDFYVDANVLLNVIRYNHKDRVSLLKMLQSLNGRIFVPYQAASEFFLSRENAKETSKKTFSNLLTGIRESTNSVSKFSTNYLLNEDITLSLNTLQKNYRESVVGLLEENNYTPISKTEESELLRFINDSLLDYPGEETIKARIIEGNFRIKNKIPPGFKDNGINGDYLIYSEVVEKTKANGIGQNAVIITADLKGDWFSNNTIHKAPIKFGNKELVSEFRQLTGKKLVVLSLEEFNILMDGEFGKKLGVHSVIQSNAIAYSKILQYIKGSRLPLENLPTELETEIIRWFYVFGAFTKDLTDAEINNKGYLEEFFDCEDEAIEKTFEIYDIDKEFFYHFRNRLGLEGYEVLKQAFDEGFNNGFKSNNKYRGIL